MLKAADPWAQLPGLFYERGVALFLGAGVSHALSVPSWDQLLDRLIAELIPDTAGLTVERLQKSGLSLPAIAGLLQKRAGNSENFVKFVRKNLYASIEKELGDWNDGYSPETWAKYLSFVRMKNPTLAAASALCVYNRGGEPIPNRNVHAVVNFNFDDLFTLYTRASYQGNYIIRITERASKTALPHQLISCYHPHGRLGLAPDASLGAESPDLLVFTEQDFFDFYNRPNVLFNYTLMFLLREYHCLFLGVSFRDENLRRLLHYSASERRDHYLREKSSKPTAFSRSGVPYAQRAAGKSLRHYAVFNENEFPGVLKNLWTESLEPLGVIPLWISDWNELPYRLGAVYGDEWPSVYPQFR